MLSFLTTILNVFKKNGEIKILIIKPPWDSNAHSLDFESVVQYDAQRKLQKNNVTL